MEKLASLSYQLDKGISYSVEEMNFEKIIRFLVKKCQSMCNYLGLVLQYSPFFSWNK